MKNFAAIDFETANNEPTSVCSVGIVIYRDGIETDRFYSLIKPEPEYYNYYCTRTHGLSEDDTRNAPVFPDVWKQIAPKLEGLPLVAHNKAFDQTCLKAVMRMYQMDYIYDEFYCTLSQARKTFGRSLGDCKLPTVALACGYNLSNHHNALADAEACAAIALKIIPEPERTV